MAITNQKGGTGKTTSCENLGAGLAKAGKRVLLVDTDPQASLTVALGHPRPDDLPVTLTDLMTKIIQDQPIDQGEGILHHPEGMDLVPANIALAGTEVLLVNTMSRETVLKQYLDTVKQSYDYILLDCMPSLGMLTVNALAAADQVLIPVQANYLSAKGLEQLLNTISRVKRQINPKLRIEGILLTMVDARTNDAILFGKSESFHTMIACINDIVAVFKMVKHTQRRSIFAIRLRFCFFGCTGRENENILYPGTLKHSSEYPFALYISFLTIQFIIIITIPITEKRCEPVIFVRNLICLLRQ